MALEIKSLPVLEGKAAREFYKRAAMQTETKTREFAQESMRTTRAFLEEQERINPKFRW